MPSPQEQITTLEYAPPQKKRQWRRRVLWAIVAIVVAASVKLSPAISSFVSRQYYTWMIRRSMDACLAFQPEENTTVYSVADESTFIAHEGLRRWKKFNACYDAYFPTRGGGLRPQGLAYIGQRRNPSGQTRLVVIEVDNRFGEIEFIEQVWDPGGNGTLPSFLYSNRFELHGASLEDGLTVFAGRGQEDQSQFIIPIQYRGKTLELVGNLTHYDTITWSGPGWEPDKNARRVGSAWGTEWWLDAPGHDLEEIEATSKVVYPTGPPDKSSKWQTSIAGDHIAVYEPTEPAHVRIESLQVNRLISRFEILDATNETTIALSPNGLRLAVATDSAWRVYDIMNGDVLHEHGWDDHMNRSNRMEWSPDGRLLAICSGNVYLWDLSEPQRIFRGPGGGPYRPIVQFSPDGKTLTVHSPFSASGNGLQWNVDEILAPFRDRQPIPTEP